jgi:hypothetical protein
MNSYKWEPVSNLNYNIEINQLWMVYRWITSWYCSSFERHWS